VILSRDIYYPDFRGVDIVETNDISAFISAVSVTDVFYILRRAGHKTADVYSFMDDLTTLFTVAPHYTPHYTHYDWFQMVFVIFGNLVSGAICGNVSTNAEKGSHGAH